MKIPVFHDAKQCNPLIPGQAVLFCISHQRHMLKRFGVLIQNPTHLLSGLIIRFTH